MSNTSLHSVESKHHETRKKPKNFFLSAVSANLSQKTKTDVSHFLPLCFFNFRSSKQEIACHSQNSDPFVLNTVNSMWSKQVDTPLFYVSEEETFAASFPLASCWTTPFSSCLDFCSPYLSHAAVSFAILAGRSPFGGTINQPYITREKGQTQTTLVCLTC